VLLSANKIWRRGLEKEDGEGGGEWNGE